MREVVRAFAALVEKEGTGIWFSKSADELATAITEATRCKRLQDARASRCAQGARHTRRLDRFGHELGRGRGKAPGVPTGEKPISTSRGSDQHRAWFQSSLLTSVAATGEAPYRNVLTNGFVVDTERKKLSKSNEGYQKPVDLMSLVNEHGADVLRLWVASQDYQDDIPFSHDIFARVADAYRSIRNTLRILLGNLADFDPKTDMVSQDDWSAVDKFFYERYLGLGAVIDDSYKTYKFSQVYQVINRFCAVDLSATIRRYPKGQTLLQRQGRCRSASFANRYDPYTERSHTISCADSSIHE